MISPDFDRLRPVPDGVSRDWLVPAPLYVAGRKDGQHADSGWQAYRRCEYGRPLEKGQPIPPAHYVLYVDDRRYYSYIHTSLLPPDYQQEPAGE